MALATLGALKGQWHGQVERDISDATRPTARSRFVPGAASPMDYLSPRQVRLVQA